MKNCRSHDKEGSGPVLKAWGASGGCRMRDVTGSVMEPSGKNAAKQCALGTRPSEDMAHFVFISLSRVFGNW